VDVSGSGTAHRVVEPKLDAFEPALSNGPTEGDDFDPYYRWLAIPPAEQPPNHYRLLGLPLFENDADVIDTSAERQMAHVRAKSIGKRAGRAQELLNELARAKLVLLDPDKKEAYDVQLRGRRAGGSGSKVVELSVKQQAPLPRAVELKMDELSPRQSNVPVGRAVKPQIGPLATGVRPVVKRPAPREAEEAFLAEVADEPVKGSWYLKTNDGSTFGPVDKAELTGWVLDGRVTDKCQVLLGGSAEWQWADEVFPLLAKEKTGLPPPRQCPNCAATIAKDAAQCRHCGSMLAGKRMVISPRRSSVSTDGVTMPVLISAIGNILFGLIWLVTCYGIVIAVPMVILCVLEFNLVSNASRMRPGELASKAQTIAVFEIIAGLFNFVSLVCGIITLVNASSLARYHT